MPAPRGTSTPAGAGEPTGCLSLIVRLSWLMVGPIVLLGLAASLAKGAHVLLDASFFVAAAGIILLRYVDMTVFKGQTADGTPDSPATWRRFAVGTVAVSAGLWAFARFVASQGWV